MQGTTSSSHETLTSKAILQLPIFIPEFQEWATKVMKGKNLNKGPGMSQTCKTAL